MTPVKGSFTPEGVETHRLAERKNLAVRWELSVRTVVFLIVTKASDKEVGKSQSIGNIKISDSSREPWKT